MEKKRKLLWIEKDPALYNNNYIGMFDLTKGLLMLQIIFVHSMDDYGNLLGYINTLPPALRLVFSPLTLLDYGPVPMLFMICGYGIRRQAVKKNVKSNLKLFIFPYICVILGVTICTLINRLLFGGSLLARLQYQVLPFLLGLHPGERFLGGSISQIGPVWFFVTYIFSCIYLNLVLQEKRTWVQGLLLGIGSVIALTTTGIPLPYCVQQTLICAGFLFVGMQLKKHKIPQQKAPVYVLILAYVACVFCATFGGSIEFSNNVFGLGGTDLMISYVVGILLLCLYQRLNVLQGLLADGLRWIGRHMLWICCFHTVTLLTGPWDKIASLFGEWQLAGILFEFGINLVIAMIGCLLLEATMKKLLAYKRKKLS